MHRFDHRASKLVLSAFLLGAVACEDDPEPPTATPDGGAGILPDAAVDLAAPDTVTGADTAGDAAGTDGGLPDAVARGPYMVSSTFTAPGNMYSSYTAVVPGIGDTTDENLRKGLETIGWIAPSAYRGDIFVPGGSTPTFTKYTTDAQGRVVKGAVVSFAGLGITNVSTGPTIGGDMLTADKAYLFDDANHRVVIWNPRTMELTGKTIDLKAVLTAPIAGNPDLTTSTFGKWARQRGDCMFVPVRWGNFKASPWVFHLSAGLLVIDTKNDTVVRLLQDDRLADSLYTVMPESGDIYLFTGALGVTFQRVVGNARPGGALRVRSGQETFDPTYYLNLDAAVGNRPASTPVWAGGTSVYLKAFHEERQPITPEIKASPRDLLGKEAWRYWKVDLEAKLPPQEITELPWTSTDGFFYELNDEGRLFIGVMAADRASTTLYEATAAGFVKTISVGGVLQSFSPLQRTR